MNKFIKVIKFIEKSFWQIFSLPFRGIIKEKEERITEFLNKVKKPYSERTDAEKILFDAFYHFKFKIQSLRYLGAMEVVLVLDGVFDFGTEFPYLENETYDKLIMRFAEQYLIDHNIL